MLSQTAQTPDAVARVRGGTAYPGIRGTVKFHSRCGGTLITADLCGLPETETNFFAFHIHEGYECSGNKDDCFANAKGHFNPYNCQHPYHAGDMPPLFGMNGRAFLAFMTDRFKVAEVLGRAVIIHRMDDDFHTQPSGNAGEKIACGVIESTS